MATSKRSSRNRRPTLFIPVVVRQSSSLRRSCRKAAAISADCLTKPAARCANRLAIRGCDGRYLVLQIVRARPAAAAVLSAIAWSAKASWGYPPHWMEQWRAELTITPEFIAENPTLSRQSERTDRSDFMPSSRRTNRGGWSTCGFYRTKWATASGRRLFAHAAAYAAERGALSLTIEADPNAEPFYRRMGATRVGTRETQIDGRSAQRSATQICADLICPVAGERPAVTSKPRVSASRRSSLAQRLEPWTEIDRY